MNIKPFVLALLPIALIACQSVQQQSTPVKPSVPASNTQAAAVQSDKFLTQYTWSYSAPNLVAPIQLNFEGQRFAVATGCNNLMGSWKVNGNQLVTSPLAATMMACDSARTKNEQFAARIFDNKTSQFALSSDTQNQAVLTITTATGQSYVFKGTQTPEATYQSEGEIIFLEISPQLKNCTSTINQKCMQVKHVKYDENGIKTHTDPTWTLFYDQIEGFQPQANQKVIIRVKRFERKNPAADQSKYAYIYDMTVEQSSIKP